MKMIRCVLILMLNRKNNKKIKSSAKKYEESLLIIKSLLKKKADLFCSFYIIAKLLRFDCEFFSTIHLKKKK